MSRDLGFDRTYLLVDYTVDCNSLEFNFYFFTILPSLLAAWPIGLPAMHI
eukprot:SAG22_NODE_4582_length_1226_cov_1.077196_1_plen_49_part_10